MDNEQLKKYIEENKAAMDTHQPAPQLWDKIEEDLHPKKKQRGLFWWTGVAASVAVVVGLFSLFQSSMESGVSAEYASKRASSKPGWKVNSPSNGGFEVERLKKRSQKRLLGQSSQEMNSKRNYRKSQNQDFLAGGTVSNNYSSKAKNKKKPANGLGNTNGTLTVTIESSNACVSTSNFSDGYASGGTRAEAGWADPGLVNKADQYTYMWDVDASSADTVYNVIPEYQNEKYDEIVENDYISPFDQPQSTFSIDVDAAGYSNVRRFINDNQLPPRSAVKLEEMVNYFNYDYAQPTGKHPFSFNTEIGECPWNDNHKLVHIGLQGKTVDKTEIPASNLVFLIDVSGSMQSVDKIELLKDGFRKLTNQLRAQDKVSIVVYAGAAGLVLEPTDGDDQDEIIEAIDRLAAGGSTAGGAGINLAYKIAEENFKKNGNNRVILATDGDFNVGPSGDEELTKMIEEKRKSGVFLTVLGFGTGDYQASKMEKLADNGNGNFAYIDNSMEAEKVMVNEFSAMYTIAKDVKLQIEFNPNKVKGYRLIGYENRMLEAEDFNDDTKDAGELGAGHTVTALYEIIPAGSDEEVKTSDSTRYFTSTVSTDKNEEFMQIKFRYKLPQEDKSKLITTIVKDEESKLSKNFYWSASVAELGLILRDSKYKGDASFDGAYKNGKKGMNDDENGYRHEFMGLIKKAQSIKK